MTKWLPLLCLGSAGLAQAGVRIESKVSPRPGLSVLSVIELQGDRFRINHQDSATGEILGSTIFDGQRILTLRAKDKTFTSVSMADLQAQADRINEMKAKMSPEGREQFDKGAMLPTFDFKRGAGGDTVAGVACENYQMTRDGTMSGIACLSPWKRAGPLTKADLAPMRKLSDQMKALGSRQAGDLEMGPDFDSWPGWPLLIRAPDGQERSRVVKVTRVSFPESDFQTPAGYTQKARPVLGGPTAP